MSSISANPFYISKLEYEEKPLFWLPQDFMKLEEGKPVYIVGSRGIGKTTLLRALCWEDRVSNKSLQKSLSEIGLTPFLNKFIGIYFRLPVYITAGLYDSCQKDGSMTLQGQRFSMYLELVSLQLLTNALIELRKLNIFNYSVETEIMIVEEIIEMFPEIADFMRWKQHDLLSLNKLRYSFFRMHTSLRTYSIEKRDIASEGLFKVTPIGIMLNEIGKKLLSLTSNDKPWKLKICFDEAECLTELQQLVINTWARSLTYPVSLVVAYARRRWDLTSTLIPNLKNYGDDVWRWDLDNEYEKNKSTFNSFSTGVANLRLRHMLNDENIIFDPITVFGDYSINDLLLNIIKSSSRPELKIDFLKKVKEFDKTFSDNIDNEYSLDKTKKTLPIYQLYLKERLGIELAPKERRRIQDSAIFRKFHVAALICFCKEFNFSVPYSGYHIIQALSDNCIRDFLRHLAFLFDAAGGDPYIFINKKINIKKQAKALYNSCQSKFNDLRKMVSFSDEIINLITGIGLILNKLQTEPKLGLSIPERGIINVSDKDFKLQNILDEAQNGGFIKITEQDTYKVTFILHRSVSPLFGLSYRQPLYNIDLMNDDLLKICKSPSKKDLEETVNYILLTIVENLDQLTLFT